MAKGKRDGGKERRWRRLLGDWRRSGLGIRAFCGQRGLPEPSFYAWRRVIAERDAARRAARVSAQTASPTWVPVAIAPVPVDTGGNSDGGIPLGECSLDETTASAMATGTAIEIAGGDGRVVRVTAGFDAATLRRVLAILDEAAVLAEAAARKDGRPC